MAKPRRSVIRKAPMVIIKRGEFEFGEWLKKKHGEAAARLEALGMDPSEVLSTEVGWLMTLPKFEDQFLEFDHFQLAFLKNKSRWRSMLKCRQAGFSFVIAAESLARCHLKERHRSVCVSYNLDDAKAKVSLAKELHDELPLEFQKKIIEDSKTAVAFRSNSRKRRISRIVSMPSKAPRGKTGDVYLDELAHCVNDAAIYTGATALILRSKGQLTVGSSPMGQRGTFWEIHTRTLNPEKYGDYSRQEVPWWLTRHFCKDVRRAARECNTMTTKDRVSVFGTTELTEVFNNMPLEDFQQEMELAFQDERVSFFPYEIILPCARKDWHEIPVYRSLDHLASVARKLGPLCLGFDVGRTGHPSQLYAFEKNGDEYIMRYQEEFRNVKFPVQRARLKQILNTLGDHVRVFRIDSTGLGRDLAETLQADRIFGKKVVLVEFTLKSKTALANNLKILLQEKNIVLPCDKDVIKEIHSIKKKFTSSGNEIFDSERSKRHHCYDSRTEILTEGGWIRFPDLEETHCVATMNDRGEMIFEKPSEIYSSPYSGPMVHVDSKSVDLIVTPNHRMWVAPYKNSPYEFVPAKELLTRPSAGWTFQKTTRWIGDPATGFSIDDGRTFNRIDFARFLGLYLAEGFCDGPHGHGRVFISQKRIDVFIDTCIDALGYRTSVEPSNDCERAYFYSKALCRYLHPLGKSWEKRIPRHVLSWNKPALEALLEAFIYDDGTISPNGNWTAYTTSQGLADDLQEVAIRIGKQASVKFSEQGENAFGLRRVYRTNIGHTRPHPLIRNRSSRGSRVYYTKPYEGNIYCCTVSNHLLLVRRNGVPVWCGNSDKLWAIALAVYKKRKARRGPATLGARVSGDKKKQAETEKTPEKKKPLEVRPDNIVERLFTLPERARPVEVVTPIKEATPDQLRRRAQSLLVAARVYRRDGLNEQANNYLRRYKGIRRTLRRIETAKP